MIKKELPDDLAGKRYKITIEGKKVVYVSVHGDNNGPMEIFSTFPPEWGIEHQQAKTLLILANRLCSLALRCGVPFDEIIKQAEKASGGKNDYPLKLAEILNHYKEDKSEKGN